MSSEICTDGTDRDIGRCEVCNKVEYLTPHPLIIPKTELVTRDLRLCEDCEKTLYEYFTEEYQNRSVQTDTEQETGQ